MIRSCSCSRMESERAAHTAALALLPIRLRHKRSTFCACPREPFPSCQALNSRPCVFARRRCYSWTHYRPSVLRAMAATPADFYVGKEKSESWQCCSTKKYHHKLLSPPTRSRTTTTTTTTPPLHHAAAMGVQKKTRKFAQMKRVIGETPSRYSAPIYPVLT